MKVIIGIDPGLEGAVSSIADSGVVIWPTPSFELSPGKNTRRAYDMPSMVDILASALQGFKPDEAMCIYERAGAMPDQSAQAGFMQGVGWGLWQGMLTAMQIPYEIVAPQRWKKVMLDGLPKGKGSSVCRAQALYPAVSLLRTPRSRLPSHDMADALLLAAYGLRVHASPALSEQNQSA